MTKTDWLDWAGQKVLLEMRSGRSSIRNTLGAWTLLKEPGGHQRSSRPAVEQTDGNFIVFKVSGTNQGASLPVTERGQCYTRSSKVYTGFLAQFQFLPFRSSLPEPVWRTTVVWGVPQVEREAEEGQKGEGFKPVPMKLIQWKKKKW